VFQKRAKAKRKHSSEGLLEWKKKQEQWVTNQKSSILIALATFLH
jgi:hypothetical protein